jgi:nicotinate-nucleotide--dimethylbenzimidazole phosphoribosyltransferase
VPAPVLRRILEAAHRAGSVGFMQPWDFVLVRSAARKAEVYELFRQATARAATRYDADRGATYGALKLQGILDAPLSVCVTCDTARGGPHVLGRDTIPETDRYSTCLAVQNLWLAARAEGVGVGWVSIVDNAELGRVLALPGHVVPVAFLCLGYPVEFPATPLLEATGWRGRLPLDAVIHEERWQERAAAAGDAAGVDAPDVPNAAVPRGDGEPWLRALAARITPTDPDGSRAARVRARLDALAMPRGSMGRLEAVAIRLATAQGRDVPRAHRRRVLVFAGDHGVTAEGVSAYRPEVTARLCYNMVAGGAVVNALLRAQDATLEVVDVGVDHAFGADARVRASKVRRGTRNLAAGPAMTRAEAVEAVVAGAAAVLDGPPVDVLAVGEVGIGNTTAAAALLALLTGAAADDVVGAGTGVGARAQARKAAAVARALARADTAAAVDPLDMLASVGGLEIGALCGAVLAAASRRVPVVLDGFITGVAALLAAHFAPDVAGYLVAAHRSAERAHGRVLDHLGLEPLLALDLRLGEASGAVLALPLVQGACALLTDVRTFEEAGIDPPVDERGAE